MSNDGIGRDIRPSKKPRARKPTQYIGPDGLTRPPAFDKKLNECFAITFSSAAGKQVLDYLRSVTTGRVLPPGLDANAYPYQEGARWLMGIIATRIKDGEDKKP
jgi:hypothetical protein